jgi:alpha-L-fucosidase
MDDTVRQAYDDYTRRQCEELMTRYGKIDVLFIDGTPKEVVKSTCWRLQPDLLITRGAMKTPEQVLPGERSMDPWLSCITMGTAWQYQPTNERYKSGNQLIRLTIEARAKGGSLLLNVGPKADGSLPFEQEDRLREMAAWYFINHECMDSVRSWVVSRENEVWFTARDAHTCYAIVTSEWKEGERKTFRLHSVKAGPETRVSVLGQNSRIIEYKQDDVGCRFQQVGESLELSVVKAQRVYDDHRWPNPVVIKLEHIDAAFDEAVDVRTLDGRTTKDGVLFSGKVFGNKRSLAKRARFYYRPYAGQVETLYSAPWKATAWVSFHADGTFQLREKNARPDRQYEYRAVVEYRQVEINGEDRVYKPATAPHN